MIIALLGKAGSGKTHIANKIEKVIKDCFIIDGDVLREETNNKSLGKHGRRSNMILGYSRARRLSDLGFTVIIAMQAPFEDIRDEYLNEYDVEIVITNNGKNPKDDDGFNNNFVPEYSNVKNEYCLQDFSVDDFYIKFFPKVLIPARFQGFHKGHKVIIEEAKRISPNITIALRRDEGDCYSINVVTDMLRYIDCKIIESPKLSEDWTSFADNYDYFVQGNKVIIDKFINSKCVLVHVPRYGKTSGTEVRSNKENNFNNVDRHVYDLL